VTANASSLSIPAEHQYFAVVSGVALLLLVGGYN